MDTVTESSCPTGVVALSEPTRIAAGTCIRTLDGILPVEFLEPGDRIVTRAGARRLVAVSVERHLGPGLVRIRATSLGHDRPERDLLIAEGQLVLVRDWRARALYGCDCAAIPAVRLADGEFILREPKAADHAAVSLFTLRFDEDEVIWAEGVELACPAIRTAEAAPSLASLLQAG